MWKNTFGSLLRGRSNSLAYRTLVCYVCCAGNTGKYPGENWRHRWWKFVALVTFSRLLLFQIGFHCVFKSLLSHKLYKYFVFRYRFLLRNIFFFWSGSAKASVSSHRGNCEVSPVPGKKAKLSFGAVVRTPHIFSRDTKGKRTDWVKRQTWIGNSTEIFLRVPWNNKSGLKLNWGPREMEVRVNTSGGKAKFRF